MTVPRGTETDSADDVRTQALATPGPDEAPAGAQHPGPPAARAEAGADTGTTAGTATGTTTGATSGTDSPPRHAAPASPAADAAADTSSEPSAIPRAGGHRPAPPGEGPSAAPAAADGPGGAPERERSAADGSSRTTVLPGPGAARPAAARPAAARPAARGETRTAGPARPLTGRTRRARLSLRRIDPWSVFLFSLVASVFLGLALIVAVAALYAVLGSLGVTESINQLFAEVTGGSPTTGALLTSGRIIGGTAVLAAVNVVFLTLLATLGALLYNLCASFTGGIELTLGERD